MKAEREKLNAKTVAAQLRLTNGEYQLQEGEDICRILLVSGSSCTLQRGEEAVLVNPGCVLLLGPGGGGGRYYFHKAGNDPLCEGAGALYGISHICD